MASVTFKDVKKIYDKNVVAVQDLNFTIEDKEFMVLVGPSGCGKSTTLRMVAGLEEISSGELHIGDDLVNEVPPKDRDIAMVFQNYALYPHMTVYDNMAFALKLRHVDKSEIDKRVREAAKTLNITELLERKPKALSGGQRQRVAIGRAIVREPRVFLMDEPLSNLDAKLRNQMRAEIIKMHKRIDTTFIYVTHDQTEAMTLGSRIVVMKDGFVQQIGTPQEVFNRPANLFVAGFIGTPQMNTFDAKLTKEDGKYTVLLNDLSIKLNDEMNKALTYRKVSAQSITMGIRPEHVHVTAANEEQSIDVSIDITEMMGSDTHLHLSLHDNNVVVRIPTVDLDEYQKGADDKTKISVKFPEALIHLFSKEDERNLIYS